MARREPGEIAGLILVEPKKFGDHRGFFSETYNRARMAELGFDREFIQDNHALSGAAGTLRGVHFQSPPFAQDKLVRVTRGAILDVGSTSASARRPGATTPRWSFRRRTGASCWCRRGSGTAT